MVNDYSDLNIVENNDQDKVVTTRAGRTIKPPSWLNDYTTE